MFRNALSADQYDGMILSDFVEHIRSQLTARVAPLFSGVSDADVVDFPHHLNCGDSIIWLGVVELMAANSVAVRSITTTTTYRRDRMRASGPIVINGGGNFGGLYPDHDELRVRILSDFPDRPVIQMPQSLEIRESPALERLKQAIARHGDFTLLVRDHRSLDAANAHFDCRTELVPDAAFALGPLTRRPPRTPVAIQARRDSETAQGQLAHVTTVDWTRTRLLSRRHIGWNAMNAVARVPHTALTATVADWFARQNLRYAVDLLSAGEVLVTDRLHGHVTALLCGIDHIVVNDRFGKIRALWDTWTHGAPHATFVPTWADALAARPDLIESRPVR